MSHDILTFDLNTVLAQLAELALLQLWSDSLFLLQVNFHVIIQFVEYPSNLGLAVRIVIYKWNTTNQYLSGRLSLRLVCMLPNL